MERLGRPARRLAIAVGSVSALALAVLADPAAAQVRCGDVIGPNETVTLTGNLNNCPPGAPALTVIGPATLDLNDFSVSCLPSGNTTAKGIVVVGKRARVRNGVVRRCANGIALLGEGSHRVDGVMADRSDAGTTTDTGSGFRVVSDNNRIETSTAIESTTFGFFISGDKNRLKKNLSILNRETGFLALFTERNVFQENVANDNGANGFSIDNGSRNSLVKNRAETNRIGISTKDEQLLKLTGNIVAENREDGIVVFFGAGHRLSRNDSRDNGEHGIVVGGALQTVITGNTALNNGGGSPQRFDLVDIGALNCGSNRWTRNVFATGSPTSCVR
jgi:parallel beta-helix repeat protein